MNKFWMVILMVAAVVMMAGNAWASIEVTADDYSVEADATGSFWLYFDVTTSYPVGTDIEIRDISDTSGPSFRNFSGTVGSGYAPSYLRYWDNNYTGLPHSMTVDNVFQVSFEPDNSRAGWPDLEPGDWFSCEIGFEFYVDGVTVHAWTDEITFTVTVPPPCDLTCSSARPDDGSSSPPFTVGQTVDWYVTIYNEGSGDMDGSAYVGYYLGTSPSDFSNRINRDSFSDLAAGDNTEEHDSYTFTASDEGTGWYLNTWVDYDGDIDEESESNNKNSYGPFTVEAGCEAPPTPIGLSSSDITESSATLHWSSVSEADGYQYAYNTTGSTPTSGTDESSTSVDLSSLDAGTTYYWWVRAYACSPREYSDWSARQEFTTEFPDLDYSFEIADSIVIGDTTYCYLIVDNSGTAASDSLIYQAKLFGSHSYAGSWLCVDACSLNIAPVNAGEACTLSIPIVWAANLPCYSAIPESVNNYVRIELWDTALAYEDSAEAYTILASSPNAEVIFWCYNNLLLVFEDIGGLPDSVYEYIDFFDVGSRVADSLVAGSITGAATELANFANDIDPYVPYDAFGIVTAITDGSCLGNYIAHNYLSSLMDAISFCAILYEGTYSVKTVPSWTAACGAVDSTGTMCPLLALGSETIPSYGWQADTTFGTFLPGQFEFGDSIHRIAMGPVQDFTHINTFTSPVNLTI